VYSKIFEVYTPLAIHLEVQVLLAIVSVSTQVKDVLYVYSYFN
jgi:hypothetical protein